MKIVLFAAALLAAAPAVAQTEAAVGASARAGTVLLDGTGKRLGRIDRVLPDGSVRLIVGEKFVTVPGNTVTVKDGVASTSLSKREASRL